MGVVYIPGKFQCPGCGFTAAVDALWAESYSRNFSGSFATCNIPGCAERWQVKPTVAGYFPPCATDCFMIMGTSLCLAVSCFCSPLLSCWPRLESLWNRSCPFFCDCRSKHSRATEQLKALETPAWNKLSKNYSNSEILVFLTNRSCILTAHNAF